MHEEIEPSAFPGERIVVASAGSTSNLARAWLVEGRPTPFVIRALKQTAGRGRGANRWYSDAGSLTFTLALDPTRHGLDPARELCVALAAASALVEIVNPYLAPRSAAIRWPNDVEIGDRKLAGLLPERVETSAGPRLLLGVGINVTTDVCQAPSEVRRLATSLAAESNGVTPSPDPDSLYEPILAAIGRQIGRLGSGDPTLPARWAALDALNGRRVRVLQGDQVLMGVGDGLTADGGLRLLVDSGPVVLYGGVVARDQIRL